MNWTIPSQEEADEFSKAYLASEERYAEQYYANEMVKPTKCPCGELFDAKDSSFCPRCGCAYGELSGRYTNIGQLNWCINMVHEQPTIPYDMKWNPDCEDCKPEDIRECTLCRQR